MRRACARRPGALERGILIGLVLLLAAAAPGCGGLRNPQWGRRSEFTGFDPKTLNRGGAADFSVLLPLSNVFYERITNRRFNSKATFDDPALRELFRSAEAFADFYASLAEALERAHFESHRPTSVRLLRMQRISPNGVDVRVRYRGENGLPLRWWTTTIERDDRWEFSGGRWFVVPGKV